MSAKAIPYVLKNDYIQVILEGQPFSLTATHPTFKKLKSAIKDKDWAKVPKLVSLAKTLQFESFGKVTVENGKVFYKNEEIKNVLASKISELIRRDKPVTYLIKFLDKLYMNPSSEARDEFYGWLASADLPITDDGEFLAYKSVDDNLKDQHTHTIDNRPGQIILGDRSWFDTNYRHQCSTGYHICSKQYGLYGQRVLAVKASPADVLSAQGGKLRVVNYEVLKELGTSSNFQQEGFPELEKLLVVEIKKERSELLRMILASPRIKRVIRQRKLSRKTLVKSAYARLQKIAEKFKVIDLVPALGPTDVYFLKSARVASGFSIGQLAKASKIKGGYKAIVKLEASPNPDADKRTAYVNALVSLQGGKQAITYPKPFKG